MKQLEELVRDATAGDRDAFACLLEGEVEPAYRVALAIVRSPEDAREVVQEAAIRAWQRLPELRSARSWPGWFRRIAVRTALDETRRARRSCEIRLVDEAQGGVADPTFLADEQVDLLEALGRLSPDDRAVIALRFGADLTVPDAAAALGIPLGTAKARLHRALGRLGTELNEDEP